MLHVGFEPTSQGLQNLYSTFKLMKLLKYNALSWIWTNGFLLIKQTLYPWVISAAKVVGVEPTILILKTRVLPVKLYLFNNKLGSLGGNWTHVIGLKVRCIATMLTRLFSFIVYILEMMGLEPIPFVCKTNVLPVILHSHWTRWDLNPRAK